MSSNKRGLDEITNNDSDENEFNKSRKIVQQQQIAREEDEEDTETAPEANDDCMSLLNELLTDIDNLRDRVTCLQTDTTRVTTSHTVDTLPRRMRRPVTIARMSPSNLYRPIARKVCTPSRRAIRLEANAEFTKRVESELNVCFKNVETCMKALDGRIIVFGGDPSMVAAASDNVEDSDDDDGEVDCDVGEADGDSDDILSGVNHDDD